MAYGPGDGTTRAPGDRDAAASRGTPVWIDTDVALGASSGDVDDGLAVAAVLAAPGPVLGISVVDGNVDAGTALAAATALRDLFPRRTGVPVVSREAAPARLAELPEGTSLLALGPLSNVAAAARLDPGLPRRCTLRFVGTVARPWRAPWLALSDRNLISDRRAARETLEHPWRLRLVFPLDVVRALQIGRGDLDRLAGSAGELGAYLARGSERWLRRARWRHLAARFPPWDLVAALDAIGELPAARFAAGRLAAFDAGAARERFHVLILRAGRERAGRERAGAGSCHAPEHDIPDGGV
jgi:inosine-uridine nucleoside N-ribohydrolase